MALVQTRLVYSSNVSADFSGVGFASSLGFEIVCVGRCSFVTPGGSGKSVICIGIWVSTLDFRGVLAIVRVGATTFSELLMVEGGEDRDFPKVEGVAVESDSPAVKPLTLNPIFACKTEFCGELPFMVIPLKVSSRLEEGELLFQNVEGDCS